VVERTASRMGRSLQTEGIKALLQNNPNHPRWADAAKRCLSCGNCTMVCPTCFCTTVDDHSDLTGASATRVRKWDSCFTLDFSYIHGGAVRQSGSARYRQWMTHKLASWYDQFGTSGCVGCGRCITWCPTGIDITAEAAAMRNAPAARTEETNGGT
jgi:Fe-S-cluster-containing hydrogenase component 2